MKDLSILVKLLIVINLYPITNRQRKNKFQNAFFHVFDFYLTKMYYKSNELVLKRKQINSIVWQTARVYQAYQGCIQFIER